MARSRRSAGRTQPPRVRNAPRCERPRGRRWRWVRGTHSPAALMHPLRLRKPPLQADGPRYFLQVKGEPERDGGASEAPGSSVLSAGRGLGARISARDAATPAARRCAPCAPGPAPPRTRPPPRAPGVRGPSGRQPTRGVPGAVTRHPPVRSPRRLPSCRLEGDGNTPAWEGAWRGQAPARHGGLPLGDPRRCGGVPVSSPVRQGARWKPRHWGALRGCGGYCGRCREGEIRGFLGRGAARALQARGHEASSGAVSGTGVGRPPVTPGDGLPRCHVGRSARKLSASAREGSVVSTGAAAGRWACVGRRREPNPSLAAVWHVCLKQQTQHLAV